MSDECYIENITVSLLLSAHKRHILVTWGFKKSRAVSIIFVTVVLLLRLNQSVTLMSQQAWYLKAAQCSLVQSVSAQCDDDDDDDHDATDSSFQLYGAF